MVDYYKTLNISKSATDDDIKKAYKKLAKQHHPDTGGDAETFRQINEAYQSLNDPVKRKNYDTYGSAEPQQFNFRSGNANPNFDFDEIFNQFGMHFGRGFQQRHQTNRDIRIQYAMDFRDVFKGKTEDVTFQLPSGSVEVIRMNVPAGVQTGNKIKFTGYGDDSIKGIPRGDLIVVITVNPDPDWRIDGRDLYTTLKLPIWELMVGKTHTLALPDMASIQLKIPPSTNPGTIFSINGHGVPDMKTGQQGKVYVEVKGFVPEFNTAQVKAITEFAAKLENIR